MQFTRRDFLKVSAASAILPSNALAHAQNIMTISDCLDLKTSEAFPIGIASGDATENSAIVTTRYAGKQRIHIAVWDADAKLSAPVHIWTVATVREGGFVRMEALGLKSFTRYRYCFVEIDANDHAVSKSRVGRFKTAPDREALVPLTIGAVSCTHNEHEPIILEHAGAREDLDVFLLLGDTSYNDGCETEKEFRASWTTSLSKKGHLDLRASTSVIATIDDHEVSDNFDPETTDPAVLKKAVRAFFDHQPVRTDGTPKIWRSFRYGRTCEIFVLDCRTERLPSTRKSSNPQYISRAQMDWLKSGLASSTAQFKVIMNSVPITEFPFIYESDRWEGYPAQRHEILHFIDHKNILGVIWLSGDFHFASVGRVSAEGPGASQTEILAGPGAQVPNYIGMGLNAKEQFDWASARNNYVTLTFDPMNYEVTLCYLGGVDDPRKTYLSPVTKLYEQKIYPIPSDRLKRNDHL